MILPRKSRVPENTTRPASSKIAANHLSSDKMTKNAQTSFVSIAATDGTSVVTVSVTSVMSLVSLVKSSPEWNAVTAE